jgi:hypothetical protein
MDLEEAAHKRLQRSVVELATRCDLAVTLTSIVGLLEEEEDDEALVPAAIKRPPRIKARYRVRRSVESIFYEHGPYYVRRAYRMAEETFWKLHVMLLLFMVQSTRKKPGSQQKNHPNGGTNGLIPSCTRLSAAMRYFAGGRPDDIAISHGTQTH